MAKQDWKLEDYYIHAPKTEFLTTGIPEFDEVAPIPKNKISIIYGPEGVGKSTLLYSVIKHMSDNSKTLFIDAEASLSPERLYELGVPPNNLSVSRTTLTEEIAEEIVQAVAEYDLIIVDSITSMSFRTEVDNDAGASNIGVKARILNQLFRQLPSLLTDNNCTLILINQERDNIAIGGKYLPGGKGQTFASSLTVRLSTIASDKFQKDGEVGGHWVRVEVRKSRFSTPWRKTKFKLYYKMGVS